MSNKIKLLGKRCFRGMLEHEPVEAKKVMKDVEMDFAGIDMFQN